MGEAVGESVPFLSDSALQTLSEPFSHTESLSETCLDCPDPLCAGGTETDGFKSWLPHLPAM